MKIFKIAKLIALAILVTGFAILATGCATSKTQTVTPNGSGGFTTNTVYTVNTNNLALDSAAAQVATAVAVNVVINAEPQSVPALKNAQAALGGILKGTNQQTTQQVIDLLKAQGNPVLAQQVTTLIGSLSAVEQNLLAKYGQGVAGQITLSLAEAVYSGLSVGLAGH